MTNIDIGLFDYDRHNALYYFIMNADEHLYMRYGGRDARSADSYLDLDSLEIALKMGLERVSTAVEEWVFLTSRESGTGGRGPCLSSRATSGCATPPLARVD